MALTGQERAEKVERLIRQYGEKLKAVSFNMTPIQAYHPLGMVEIERLLWDKLLAKAAARKGVLPRPSNPFILYQNKLREKVQSAIGAAPLGEVNCLIGAYWSTEADQQSWKELGKLLMVRFREAAPDHEYTAHVKRGVKRPAEHQEEEPSQKRRSKTSVSAPTVAPPSPPLPPLPPAVLPSSAPARHLSPRPYPFPLASPSELSSMLLTPSTSLSSWFELPPSLWTTPPSAESLAAELGLAPSWTRSTESVDDWTHTAPITDPLGLQGRSSGRWDNAEADDVLDTRLDDVEWF